MSGEAVIDAVVSLCKGFGHGRVMQIVETDWRRKDPRGALVVVCCAAEEGLYRAAPELLEMLKSMVARFQDIPATKDRQLCDLARALIAKAEGESMNAHALNVLLLIRDDMQLAIDGGRHGGQKTNGGNGPLGSATQLPSVVAAFRRYVEAINVAIEMDQQDGARAALAVIKKAEGES